MRSIASPRPPLTRRLRPRHWMAIDAVVALGFGVIIFSMLRKSMETVGQLPSGVVVYQETRSTADPGALILVTVAVLAVAFRRRRPVFMLGALLAGSVASTVFSGSEPVRLTGGNLASLVYFLPIGYVLYLIAATYERTRTAVRVLGAVFGVIAVDVLVLTLDSGRYPARVGMLIPVVLGLIIIWSAGYIVRQRRRYALGLQAEAASKAVAQERLRIARELHDVVAHSMSVIAVQAGFGQYVIDSQPADAGAALAAIQMTSRDALEEMRRMLGVLRQTDEVPAELYPAPGLAELDRLLERTRSVGIEVVLERRGTPRDLPATVDLSAYRVIQEALTNVVKHARASRCGVLLGYEPAELVIEVTDGGAGVPAMAGAGGVTAPAAGATASSACANESSCSAASSAPGRYPDTASGWTRGSRCLPRPPHDATRAGRRHPAAVAALGCPPRAPRRARRVPPAA